MIRSLVWGLCLAVAALAGEVEIDYGLQPTRCGYGPGLPLSPPALSCGPLPVVDDHERLYEREPWHRPSPTPEPQTWVLVVVGVLLVLVLAGRHRQGRFPGDRR